MAGDGRPHEARGGLAIDHDFRLTHVELPLLEVRTGEGPAMRAGRRVVGAAGEDAATGRRPIVFIRGTAETRMRNTIVSA
ncbi:hypothetical protein D3C80_2034790 [compost metagenome]